MTIKNALLCGAAVTLPLFGQAASAQVMEPSDSAPQGAVDGSATANPASEGQLRDIVVTAQRRAQNLQRVPVAVTAVTSETLSALQVVKPSQLIFVAPSLQQQTTVGEVGATNFAIRGVGSAIFGNSVESSVATVIDDVTLARPQLGVSQFFDIDNVQILRGPQGTLFGKNATSGVVSINTRRPQLGQTTFDFAASSGIHDSIGERLIADGNATVNLPLGGNAAIRLSGFGVRQDGVLNDIGTANSDYGLTEFGGRAKVLWEPLAKLEVYVAGEYVSGIGKGDGSFTERVNAPGGVVGLLQGQSGIVASPDNLTVADGARSFQRFQAGSAQANIKYTLGSGHTITDIAAYRFYRDLGNNDFDQTPFSFADGFFSTRDYHQVSNELRFASPSDGRLTYQAGLYYLDFSGPGSFLQAANFRPLVPVIPGMTYAGSNRYFEYSSQSYAAFGQAEFKVVDGLSLLAGGRFTHDEVNAQNTFDTTGFVVKTATAGVIRNQVKTDNFSYKVGLNYQITPGVFAYASYAKGYKGPALDQTTLVATRAEIPYSIEAGLKTTFFDRKLSINLAAFHTIYRDFQAQAFQVLPGSTIGNFTTINAGRLRTQGFEGEFRAVPFQGFTLSGGASYIDGIYTSFTGAPCYPGQPTGTSGQGVCLPNKTTDASGGRLTNSPRFTFNLAGQYEVPVRGGKAFVGGDLYHRSSQGFNVAQDPRAVVGSIDLVGARIGFKGDGGRWEFAIFGRNLTDKRYATFITPNPIGSAVGDDAKGGDYYQTFGAESFRTIGVSFTGHFR